MSNTTAIDTATTTHRQDATGLRSEELQERIRERAYELFEARGAVPGHDLEDWVMAESEILVKRKVPRAA